MDTPRVNPYLYLPMEIASREMDSRLLLTLFAAKAGLDVILGQKWLLQKNVHRVPAGAWMFKTLTPSDAKNMALARQAGHWVCAIDEEMPGLGNGAERLQWVDPGSVAECNALFCLGDRHVEIMAKRYPQHAERLLKVGNPRWDLMRPELRAIYQNDAKALQAQHGSFILINTNIGLLNSAKKSADALLNGFIKDGKIDLSLAEDRHFVEDRKIFEAANFQAAAPLAKRLCAAFSDRKVILRPHPTEKLEPYIEALAGEDRIEVIQEGPAGPWISACDVLVHTSCTTASEAFAFGKPSVCYETVPASMHEYLLSGALSDIAKTEDDVIDAVRSALNGAERSDMAKKREVFHHNFAGQEGALAAERMVSHITAATHGTIRKWAPSLSFRRWNWRTEFQKRIFPDFSANHIRNRLSDLAAVLEYETLPQVDKIGRGLFRISYTGVPSS